MQEVKSANLIAWLGVGLTAIARPVTRRLQQTDVHDVAMGMLGRGTNNKNVEVDRFLHAHELELFTHGEP
jgi:hypothetical protein